MLNWIPRTIPEFTDHGILHSTNVLRNIIKIHENCVKFTQNEKYILAIASFVHDFGCLINRDRHNYLTLEMLDKGFVDIKEHVSYEEYNSLCQTILSHKKDYDLNLIFENLSKEINLKKICPLFRLADSSDIGKRRIAPKIYKILLEYNMLSEKSKKIWASHLSIEDIEYYDRDIEIYVNDLITSDFCLNDFKIDIDIINEYLEKTDQSLFNLKIIFVPKKSK